MAKNSGVGGIIQGQLHSQCNPHTGCGEKFIVNNEKIEAEKDEAILTGEAEHQYPTEVFEIHGTIKQIASAINTLGGGNAFAAGAKIMDEKGELFKVINRAENAPPARQITGTVYFINRRSMNDERYYRVKGTVRQIASAINGLHSPVNFEPGGEFFKQGGIKTNDAKVKRLIHLLEDPCLEQTQKGKEFVEWMLEKIRSGHIFKNRLEFEKKANSLGIDNPRDIKELAEMAIVVYAGEIAQSGKGIRETYTRMVQFYQRQPNMTLRTSATITLQQYSTPTPISYLLGIFCGFNKPGEGLRFLEPSAGNGMLTIAGKRENFIVNEIDKTRLCTLHALGFGKITDQDGTHPFPYKKELEAMITNPPFASMEKIIEGIKITGLENIMAINALETIKDDGRAAIITGGHLQVDSMGRIAGLKDKVFLNWLYRRYNILDVINISGSLYAKQGTQFKIRAVLINGRRETDRYYPLADSSKSALDSFAPKQVNNFEELYTRMEQHID